MQNKLKTRFLIFSFITALMFFTGWGCDDNSSDDDDSFDVGPEDEPNFKASGFGIEGDVSIGVEAQRDDREVDGFGELFIGDERFSFEVIDATLSTDLGMDPIPQTDPSQPFTICTPSFVCFTIDIDGTQAELQLNECEEHNPEIFVENGVVINPCTGEEVTDIEAFKGVCLPEEPGKDSIVLNEFNGNCTADDPCVVPFDIVIFVPLFNPDIDPDIDLGDIIDDIL